MVKPSSRFVRLRRAFTNQKTQVRFFPKSSCWRKIRKPFCVMEHQKCLSGTRLADTPDRTRARQLLPNGQKWKQAVGRMAGSKFCNTTINFYVKEIEEDQPLLCVRRRSLAADKNENNRSSHSRADKNCTWTCLLEYHGRYILFKHILLFLYGLKTL